MNCFGSHTESTESLIRHEEEDEDVAVIREDMREVLVKDEIVEIKDEDEDEVGEEMEEEEKPLTGEELRAIAQEVNKREEEKEESPDFVAQLLEHCINTILLEEMTGVGRKMNAFRRALATGVMKFAEREEAENSTVKMDRFVDSFRAAWKDWKEKEDQESVVNVFMQEMDNELWYPDR